MLTEDLLESGLHVFDSIIGHLQPGESLMMPIVVTEMLKAGIAIESPAKFIYEQIIPARENFDVYADNATLYVRCKPLIPQTDPNKGPTESFVKPVYLNASARAFQNYMDSYHEQNTVLESSGCDEESSFYSAVEKCALSEREDSDSEFDLLAPSARGRLVDKLAVRTKMMNCPMFTRDVLKRARNNPEYAHLFPQYGLFGQLISRQELQNEDPRLYINSNNPSSTIVTGVQGSGKSHTVSTLLESCLVKDRKLGNLPAPLAGLVCHFDNSTTETIKPCEAAFLSAETGKPGVKSVTILVSPSNYGTMCKVYASLPNVHVRPLFFSTSDLNISRMLTLMSVDTDEALPLYMQVVEMLLRDLGDEFTYTRFRHELSKQQFTPLQSGPLTMRLALLDSFLGEQVASKIPGANRDENVERMNAIVSLKRLFRPGHLVIVDLTDPFIDTGAACALFDIMLGLFMETKVDSGKVVVLDEAHKYLQATPSSSRLTSHLLSLIRQQRHMATRVIISTQEPTVLPESLIDLSPIIIAHRFSSPAWWNHLKSHVVSDKDQSDTIFENIVRLEPGEAILFSSSALTFDNVALCANDERYKIFGSRPVKIRVRKRITRDGGRSLFAVDSELSGH
eukprot:Partr_v1_DN28762_c1_g1_i1_m62958 putative Inherit from NOG: Conserved hypothetical, protein